MSELSNATIWIHFINLIISTSTIIVLITLAIKTRNIKKDEFIAYMLYLPAMASFHIALFSLVLFIDNLDGIVKYIVFDNYWALFIRTQVCLTLLWLSVMAFLRYAKGAKHV